MKPATLHPQRHSARVLFNSGTGHGNPNNTLADSAAKAVFLSPFVLSCFQWWAGRGNLRAGLFLCAGIPTPFGLPPTGGHVRTARMQGEHVEGEHVHVTDGKALSDQQQRFIDEYLIDCNSTQAAIRAGYAKRSAQPVSSRLLSNAMVAEEIARHQPAKQTPKNVDIARAAALTPATHGFTASEMSS